MLIYNLRESSALKGDNEGTDLVFSDDSEAMAVAMSVAAMQAVHIEVWSGARFVGRAVT